MGATTVGFCSRRKTELNLDPKNSGDFIYLTLKQCNG